MSEIVPTMVYGDFIDEYMDKAPLTVQAYLTDAAELHTNIIKFTSGNPVAEANMVHNAQKNDGRLNFIALKNHYEGVGVHAIDIVKSDNIIQDLFYSDEKRPHLWWDEFERQLTDAFNTYDRHEKRSVHSENKKLCMLNRKINADFLQSTKSSIKIMWAAAEEVAFEAELEVVTAEEAGVAAEEYFMVDVDDEANMAEEAGKTWYINSPDPMPEWYSLAMARR